MGQPDKPLAPLVLVTGASGYIASHCVKDLLEQGYSVRGTVRSLKDQRKVAHLHALTGRGGARLDLVEADLTRDAGWREAVRGCTYVLHVASPFPASVPEDENEIIQPAVEGTRRVLEASAGAGTVRRVVLTSSVAAVAFGHDPDPDKVYTEADWSNAARCEPYQKSKTLAERAAWDFVAALPEGKRFELAVINPGFVAGPVLGQICGTSGEVVRRLLVRGLPACPEIGWAIVDVRDVARAHRLAMETPAAAGNRYIVAGDHVWMRECAQTLAEVFAPLGYKVPTGRLPYWLMWVVGRFDKTVRMALGYVGLRQQVSHEKARRDLGWTPRPVRDTLVDMARSLIEQGIVPPPRQRAAA
jgi:nucleoside-diphosphate-sugar epimerase